MILKNSIKFSKNFFFNDKIFFNQNNKIYFITYYFFRFNNRSLSILITNLNEKKEIII